MTVSVRVSLDERGMPYGEVGDRYFFFCGEHQMAAETLVVRDGMRTPADIIRLVIERFTDPHPENPSLRRACWIFALVMRPPCPISPDPSPLPISLKLWDA